jgi:hypothetical protein
MQKQKIIMSISTIPGRSDSLIQVLEELKKQTLKPDLILITICKYYPRLQKTYDEEEKQKITNYAKNHETPIKIIIEEKDVGSCLKVITPIKHVHEDCLIITMDDDSPLYEKAIETLTKNYIKYGEAIYCIMGLIENETQKIYVHGEYLNQEIEEVNILGGYRGVLYPKKLLNNKLQTWINTFVEEHEKQNLMAMHDDHIISYYFNNEKIPIKVCRIPKNPNNNEYENLHYEPINNNNGIWQDNKTQQSFQLTKEIHKKIIQR